MKGIYSMAHGQGNEKRGADTDNDTQERLEQSEAGGRLPALPELARRVLSIGLSGFFLTEETIRKALGDTLPKDWTDFAVEQSERTRKEFLERLSYEIAQSIEKADLAGVFQQMLEGRTLEIRAEIRLGSQDDGAGPKNPKLTVRSSEGKK